MYSSFVNYSRMIKNNLAAGLELMNIKKKKRKSKTEPYNFTDLDQDALKERLVFLLGRFDNYNCADCFQRGPMWASVTFGTFVCFACSDFHRNLGGVNVCHQVSLIKSVNLDDWTVAQVEFMEKKGNLRSNKYYEATLPTDFIRPTHQHPKKFRKFLYDKYVLLRYIPADATIIPISNTAATSLKDQSEEQYKCDRDGGKDDHELDKFIEKIGENRKITPKETAGPLYYQQILEKQSLKMKENFLLDEKRRQDQLLRSVSAIDKINQRKKEFNRRKSEEMKPLKEEETSRQQEIKSIRHEEKSQRYLEGIERRTEKKNEMKKKKRFLFSSNFSYKAPPIYSFHDTSSEGGDSFYPPVPKKSHLYKIDKKGMKYSIQEETES